MDKSKIQDTVSWLKKLLPSHQNFIIVLWLKKDINMNHWEWKHEAKKSLFLNKLSEMSVDKYS